jgi:putative FmdB family regulatory protein
LPIYEYQCERCGAVTDIKHGFKESPSEGCAKCGSHELKRLFNPAPILFKGSGFYVNDSRKGSAASSPDSAAKPSVKPDAGATADSGAKSDAPGGGSKPDGGGKGEAAA